MADETEDQTEENLADEKVESPPEDIMDELGAIFDKANEEESDEKPADTAEADGAEEETTEETTDQESAEAEEEGEEIQPLDVPASWSAAEQALWPNLTREAQEVFLRRESDWQKADGERANKLKGYEPMDAALEPVRSQLALNGVEPATYVRQLVAADNYLKTQPEAALQWLAQQYGIDLQQITQAESDVDPAVAPILKELNTLKGQFNQYAQQQQTTEAGRTNAEIEAFAKDKPHFEEVRQQMGVLIQTGAAQDLQTAYDNALWANPDIRAKLQAEQSAEAEKKRKEEAATKAKKAKRVADTNLSNQGTGGGATPQNFESREKELEALYDEIQGAA